MALSYRTHESRYHAGGPLSEHEGGGWKHRNRPKSEAPAGLGAVRHADAAIVTAEFKLPFETLTQAALKLH